MQKKIKILLCDDHEAIRESVKIILDDPGYNLHFAVDGKEALEKAKAVKPAVVLLDIKMPKLSGLDIIEEIISLAPEAKIIMISGYEHSEVVKEALNRGAADYLPKSFSGEQLKSAIQNVLKKE